jgi:hypothetical protein
MLKSTSQNVVLEMVGGVNGGCGPGMLDFVRVLADGNSQSGPGGLGWRVPAGKALVITDVNWQYIHPQGAAAASQIQVLRLFVENLATRGIRGERLNQPSH